MYGPGVEKIYDEIKKIFPKKILKYFLAIILKKKNQRINNEISKK